MGILLTRPAGKNDKIAIFFKEHNIITYECPLLKIYRCDRSLDDLHKQKSASHLILTSQNALAALVPENQQAHFFVVGTQTAQALRKRGFNKIQCVAASASELWQKMCQEPFSGKTYYYLSGDRITFDFCR